MKEERNQSVQFSEIMNNISDDSVETSLKKKNEVKKSNRQMILLGVKLFAMFIIMMLVIILILLIHDYVAIVFSRHVKDYYFLTKTTASTVRIIDANHNKDVTSRTSTSSASPQPSLATIGNRKGTANIDYNITSPISTSSTLPPPSLRTVSDWKGNISTTSSSAFGSKVKDRGSY